LINPNDLRITLGDLVAVLNSSQLKFHLTGGLASSFYGEPRFTQDIDVVIRVAIGQTLNQLVQALAQKFIVDADAIADAVLRKGIFQALHEESMIKVDFHVGEAIRGELDRSHSEEILAGVVVPLVSKEDAILSKLLWIAKGSGKSRQDVRMMLKRSGEIDFTYLNSQAADLGVANILNDIRDVEEIA